MVYGTSSSVLLKVVAAYTWRDWGKSRKALLCCYIHLHVSVSDIWLDVCCRWSSTCQLWRFAGHISPVHKRMDAEAHGGGGWRQLSLRLLHIKQAVDLNYLYTSGAGGAVVWQQCINSRGYSVSSEMHHGTKTFGEVQVLHHAYLIWAVDEGECQLHALAALPHPSGKEPPVPRAGLAVSVSSLSRDAYSRYISDFWVTGWQWLV
jgi:hypothetical protein